MPKTKPEEIKDVNKILDSERQRESKLETRIESVRILLVAKNHHLHNYLCSLEGDFPNNLPHRVCSTMQERVAELEEIKILNNDLQNQIRERLAEFETRVDTIEK